MDFDANSLETFNLELVSDKNVSAMMIPQSTATYHIRRDIMYQFIKFLFLSIC